MNVRPPNKLRDLAHEHRHPLSLILCVLTCLAILLLVCPRVHAVECPDWCIRGLIATETSSYIKLNGAVVYVNQRRGLAGEVGIGQAMPRTLRRFGFSPSLYEQDTAYALNATRFILCRYFDATGSWWSAVAKWRMETNYQSPAAQSYARRVSDAAGETK